MKTIKDMNLTKNQKINVIKGKLKIYGYSYGDQPMKIDRSLFESARILVEIPQISKVPDTEAFQMNSSEVRDSSMKFFDNFFTLHDIRTISQDDFSNIVTPYYHSEAKPKELLELCDILESSSTMINPFDLPISYIPNSQVMAGITQKPMFIKNNDKFLKRQNVYFSGISLGAPISAITPYTYNHEITHTQVESVKGSVRDYQNSEVLPILVELIAAYETESNKQNLSFMIRTRLRDVLEKMALLYQGKSDFNSMLTNTVYVKSTLQALHLFDIYLDASADIRSNIIKGIQEIFDGKLVLESFLMKYEVDFKRSSDSSLIKKYSRKYL